MLSVHEGEGNGEKKGVKKNPKMSQMQFFTDLSKPTKAGSGSGLNSIFVLFKVFPRVIMENYKEILYLEPDMLQGNECFLWSWFEFRALSTLQNLACAESLFILNHADMTIYDRRETERKIHVI